MRDFVLFTFAFLRNIIIILYFVCFGCYILFTRQPDFFDGEKTTGTIVEKNKQFSAVFFYNDQSYFAEVPYRFMVSKGEKVQVIYEAADPSNAKQYSIIGYWITFGELFASIFIVAVLYWIAVSITKNPTPEALIEELEAGKKKPRKPKYDL